MIMTFQIEDVHCGACVKLSNAALTSLPGVKRVEIDEKGLTVIESDSNLTWDEVKNALASVDKKATLI